MQVAVAGENKGANCRKVRKRALLDVFDILYIANSQRRDVRISYVVEHGGGDLHEFDCVFEEVKHLESKETNVFGRDGGVTYGAQRQHSQFCRMCHELRRI